jgi:hypothetical protein
MQCQGESPNPDIETGIRTQGLMAQGFLQKNLHPVGEARTLYTRGKSTMDAKRFPFQIERSKELLTPHAGLVWRGKTLRRNGESSSEGQKTAPSRFYVGIGGLARR